ncbi:hypothetical protein [Streptomyces sp. NPDC049040]|uniref:hypothetical protein n=1 Tax=Streptomyces sp. NPDC049040 TaxID=3365593 RepID=UPI00372028E0
MRFSAGVLARLLLPVAVVAGLTGCSSSDDDKTVTVTVDTSAPGAPIASGPASATPTASDTASASASAGSGGTHGRVDYTGASSGGFDVTMNVGCTTHAGKLLSATAPDGDDDSTTPSFSVNIGPTGTAVLITPDNRIFIGIGAKGLSAGKQGGVWTVTAAGAELDATDTSGGHVTVTGRLTCTKVSDIGTS